MTDSEVVFESSKRLGYATLNRPKALNSLNLNMVSLMRDQYLTWAGNVDIKCIVLKATGGKAFCAGGDVKAVVQDMLESKFDYGIRFFQEEYALDHLVATMPQPQVALLDGITMGGGAGISINGTFRVATEKTLFAMPECGIGLYPDVGAAHFLNQLPGHMGMYLALTGTRLKGVQVKEAGLATHYLASHQLPSFLQELEGLGSKAGSSEAVRQLLSEHEGKESQPEPSGLLDLREGIDTCFAGSSCQAIYTALQERGDSWSQDTLKALHKGSPLSQRVSFRALRQGVGRSLPDILRTDFRLSHRMVSGPSDFAEGVRALLIDKGNTPAWRHSSVDQVRDQDVDLFFSPLSPEEELQLADSSAQAHAKL
ncbi:hypothetical protein WJX84_000370 [Apatococcus fuscideae]|uniref:3-hydroxyisobutyryl-CoA hydrolase n=1 Tax=Apatococcus fuscideae TaxID=2026836 RepID=A0AAW1SPY2_9CHLO